MTGFLKILNKGDTLPFQKLNARFGWADMAKVNDYLPNFFSDQFEFGNDIAEIIIYKLDINLLKQSENYTDLVAARLSSIVLSNPEIYIEKVTKQNNNIIYKSFLGKKFDTILESGIYYIEFKDSTLRNSLMSDVFCIEKISFDIVGIIQNLLNSYLISGSTVFDNSGNEINGLLRDAKCLDCTTSTTFTLIDSATITSIHHLGTAELRSLTGTSIEVRQSGTVFNLEIVTSDGNRQYPICEGAGGDFNILHNIFAGDSKTHLIYENATWINQSEYFRFYYYNFDYVWNETGTEFIMIPRKNDDTSNVII